jgi:hypothetical protein
MAWPSQWAPARQVDRFMTLSRDQQEFFMSLLPNWHFSVDELIEATICLCD